MAQAMTEGLTIPQSRLTPCQPPLHKGAFGVPRPSNIRVTQQALRRQERRTPFVGADGPGCR